MNIPLCIYSSVYTFLYMYFPPSINFSICMLLHIYYFMCKYLYIYSFECVLSSIINYSMCNLLYIYIYFYFSSICLVLSI